MGTLLACADTNAAVDNLVEGLLARGIRVARVGNPAKVGAGGAACGWKARVGDPAKVCG